MKDGSGKQKAISKLVLVGGGICLLGFFMLAVSFFLNIYFGVIFGMLLIPIGVVVVILGLATGWGEAFGDPSKKPIRREMNVYVIAKIIADSNAELVVDPEFYDPEELSHLVQIQFQGGRKVEFETAPEVYDEIGEGMSGDIIYQGKWLNQFTFRPKQGASDIGEDPFRAGKL